MIRCALAIVTLALSGIASASLNYDYANKVLFDSSTSLYWTSGPKDLNGWQVATADQTTSLFSEVGFSSYPGFSGPATFSTTVADLVLFFSTGAPSPRPILGSLPSGDLGTWLPYYISLPGMATYEAFPYASNAPRFKGFDEQVFIYSGSTDLSLNDWRMSDSQSIGEYGGLNRKPLPSDATFYLVSATNPVPEAQTWLLLVVGLGVLSWMRYRSI